MRLFPLAASEGEGYWLVHPEARAGSRKIRRFRDWLIAEIGRDFASAEQS